MELFRRKPEISNYLGEITHFINVEKYDIMSCDKWTIGEYTLFKRRRSGCYFAA